MELRHLRYFVAVAEELHFRRAADRLHISQPPLSLQIRQLEDELGTTLFERTRQKVLLTAAGRAFLAHARLILAQADTAKSAAALAAQGEAGELRIGFTQSVQFIPQFLSTVNLFRSRFPGVTLSLHEMDSVTQIDAIAERHIELGIMHSPSDPVEGPVRVARWMLDPLLLATARSGVLGKRKTVSVADLSSEALICTPRYSGFGLQQHLHRICWAHGFTPHVVHEATALASIVVMVATGLGSAVVPQSIRAIGVPGVVYLPFVNNEAAVDICIATHTLHDDALAMRFHGMLTDAHHEI